MSLSSIACLRALPAISTQLRLPRTGFSGNISCQIAWLVSTTQRP
jgi:hypothetical protein